MYTRPDTPQNITGVLDDGFRLFSASLKTVLPLSFIGSLLATLPQFAISLMGENPQIEDFNVTLVIAGVAVTIGLLLAMVVCYCGVLVQMEGFASGTAPSLGDALMTGLSRTLPLIGGSLLFTLGVFAGMILLVVPGVVLAGYWVLCFVTAVVDRKGPVQCLSYSYHLIRGAWWRTMMILTVLMLINMVIYTILMVFLIGGMVGSMSSSGAMDTTVIDIITLLVTPLLSTVLTPFGYAFLLAIRNDLKMRKEGSDLAARINNNVVA